MKKRRHPYETRLQIRGRLPWFLINLGFAGKGADCEKAKADQSWYNMDGELCGCYYCRVVKKGEVENE